MPPERARNKRPPRPNPSYPESNFESFEMVPQLSAKSVAAESYLALPAALVLLLAPLNIYIYREWAEGGRLPVSTLIKTLMNIFDADLLVEK